jgi:intergrase/recombinase
MWIVKQINEREIMNEQLAQKIRSQLSGKESYDHWSPSSLNIPSKNILLVMFVAHRKCEEKTRWVTKLIAAT